MKLQRSSVQLKPKYSFLNPYCLEILMAVFTDPCPSFCKTTLNLEWSRGVQVDKEFTTAIALGMPDSTPQRTENFQCRLPSASANLDWMTFFRVSTVPNCRETCAPTPRRGKSMPLQNDRIPQFLMVLEKAWMIPVYQSGFETILILMFSKGSMMTVCAQPEQHPQNKSLAICRGEAIAYSSDITITFILQIQWALYWSQVQQICRVMIMWD